MALVALIPGTTTATDAIPGPINARVVSVYDGDTLTVDADPWPGLTAHTKVRVAGGASCPWYGVILKAKNMRTTPTPENKPPVPVYDHSTTRKISKLNLFLKGSKLMQLAQAAQPAMPKHAVTEHIINLPNG